MDCLLMKSWKRRVRHLKEIRKSLRGGIRRIPGNLLQHRTGIRTAPMKFPARRRIPEWTGVKQGSGFPWKAGKLPNGIFAKPGWQELRVGKECRLRGRETGS